MMRATLMSLTSAATTSRRRLRKLKPITKHSRSPPSLHTSPTPLRLLGRARSKAPRRPSVETISSLKTFSRSVPPSPSSHSQTKRGVYSLPSVARSAKLWLPADRAEGSSCYPSVFRSDPIITYHGKLLRFRSYRLCCSYNAAPLLPLLHQLFFCALMMMPVN